MSGEDLTAKQEAFARLYFENGNAAEAYRTAYDTDENARDNWVYVEASQLLDHPKISQRIAELQEEAAKMSLFTVFQAYKEYEEARKLAHDEKNPSAAVGAVSGKVKLFGLEAPTKRNHVLTGPNNGPIQTEEVGQGAAKLAAFLDSIAERSGTTGEPDA